MNQTESAEILNTIQETLTEHGAKSENNLSEVFVSFYKDLKRLASSMLWKSFSNETIQATALVHEAYFKFQGQRNQIFQDKKQFMAIAARLMQRILIDRAREKLAEKRGGDFQRTDLKTSIKEDDSQIEKFLDLSECIDELAKEYDRQAQVLKLHFFLGLELEEISGVLDISIATTKRDLAFSKAWLADKLK